MYKSFKEMPVWQVSLNLSIKIFEISQSLPKSEAYGFKSQILRSSNSITANIAEAFGRSGSKDKINFYNISRGSAFETQSHLIYGAKVNYFAQPRVDKLLEDYNLLIYDLNKIIKSLRRS
jgi:four helix bundle protein